MDERERMVEEMKERYGLDAQAVFSAMLRVPRHKFVSKRYKDVAYRDGPVPIEQGQTMSQPYTVAFMTHLLVSVREGKREVSNWRVLEIGTGSGYQAAVLSHLVGEVYTIEIIEELAEKAKVRLKRLGYKNVQVRAGSGEKGWREKAPFDAILVTAGISGKVPQELLDQLKERGVLVAPVGRGHDKVMTRYKKLKDSKIPKFQKEKFGIFHFVPFIEESD